MSTGTRTVAWRRPALRALQLVVLAGAIAVALLLFAGRAHADTATPTAGSDAAITQTPSVPAAGPGPAGANPATPAPATPPAAKSITRTAYTAPSATSATQPPASSGTGNTATTGTTGTGTTGTGSGTGSTPAPASTGTQNATVGNTGVAVSNSGANSATGVSSQVPAASAPPTAGSLRPGVTVGTGNANATGVDAKTGITQQVDAHATGAAQIHVLQIALVVDVGIAGANSGHNVGAVGNTTRSALGAGFGTGPGSGVGIATGNGKVVGTNGATGVIQSARITNGDATSQSTFVVNIGIAFANSGTNIALVGHALGQKGMSAVGIAKISTGNATAIGDRATSTIAQIASLTATDAGILNVDQRAIIVNIGIALANTGLNGAGDSLSSLSGQDGALVQAILDALFGGPTFPLLDGASATGSAGIHTGSVLAIGNDTKTSIGQGVNGAVSGTGAASANQRAFVTNLGIAVGNSGANLAALGLSPTSAAQLDAVDASIASFLDAVLHPTWVTDGSAAPDLASTVNLGDALLNVNGDVTGTLRALGTPTAADPTGASVTVEQISGVLHVSVALADTGGNLAFYSGPLLDEAAALHGLSSSGGNLVASITTGNVDATGAHFGVRICQSEHDHACDPKPVPQTPPPGGHTPTPPVSNPTDVPVVEAEVLIRPAALPQTGSPAQAAAATSLPFTGSGSLPEEVLAAIAAIGAGLGAQLTRRRRAATTRSADPTRP